MAGIRRLEVRHSSRYVYNGTVRRSIMRLCLKPRDNSRQHLLRFRVETDPPAPLREENDYFGNAKHVLTLPWGMKSA